jgi:hypothetical protein
MNETRDHDKLLSGRVKARFGSEALRRAAQALPAATEAVLLGVPDEELDDAVNAYWLLRALKLELS